MTSSDPAARLEALEAVFAALAHPARRQILLTVHFRGEMTAGDVAGRFAHAWPTTTRHMRVLEAAGLLTHERRGRERYYRANRERLDLARDWIGWFYRSADASAERDAGETTAAASDDAVLRELRAICLALPDAVEAKIGGAPTFRVDGRVFAGIGEERGRRVVALKLAPMHAAMIVDDDRFWPAPHVGHKGWVSMDATRIESWADVRALVVESYRLVRRVT